MFKKFFKSVAAKLLNAGKKPEPPKPQPKVEKEIPVLSPSDNSPKFTDKIKPIKLGKNQAKRRFAILALGKTRKQLRELKMHIRPKVAKNRARKMGKVA